jgi:hypothetical protein
LAQPAQPDAGSLAKTALNRIEKKLKGIYSTREKQEKEKSTSNLVQMLIQEASDPVNLVSRALIDDGDGDTVCRGRCMLVGLRGTRMIIIN